MKFKVCVWGEGGEGLEEGQNNGWEGKHSMVIIYQVNPILGLDGHLFRVIKEL